MTAAGNLRTSDFGGPYNLSLLNVQEAEVKSEPLNLVKFARIVIISSLRMQALCVATNTVFCSNDEACNDPLQVE